MAYVIPYPYVERLDFLDCCRSPRIRRRFILLGRYHCRACGADAVLVSKTGFADLQSAHNAGRGVGAVRLVRERRRRREDLK